MKKQVLQWYVLLLLIALHPLSIKAQQNVAFDWVQHYGGPGAASGIGTHYNGNFVAVDDFGNVYATVRVLWGGAVNFGSFSFNSDPDSTFDVLTKSDSSGNILWARQIYSPLLGGFGTTSIAVDKSAGKNCSGQQPDIIIAGTFFGTIKFNDSVSLVARGYAISEREGFIAKYNSEGDVVWVKHIKNAANAVDVHSVSTDSEGNVYATGYSQGTLSVAGSSVSVTSSFGTTYVLKLNKLGDPIWIKTIERPSGSRTGTNEAWQITVSAANDIYLTGKFTRAIDFNMSPAPADTFILTAYANNSYPDAFVAKYDSSGKFIWAANMGGKGQDEAYSIAVDIEGNTYVSGRFKDTFFCGRDMLIPTIYEYLLWGVVPATDTKFDIFITKIDPSGNFVWSRQLKSGSTVTSNLTQAGSIIATHPTTATGVYIGGNFSQDSTDFDPGPGSYYLKPDAGGLNGFILRLDNDGNFSWVKTLKGDGLSYLYGLAIDKKASIHAVGGFIGSVDFNPDSTAVNSVTAIGSARLAGGGYIGTSDGYILKLISTDTNSASINVTLTCDEGSQYIIECDTFTQSGTYTHRFTNHLGADSILTLNITFEKLDVDVTIEVNVLRTLETYATYQWYKDGVLIPGANERSYTVSENGRYHVEVTNERGCEGISEEYLVTNVSVTDISWGNNISIYPNPAKDKIYVNSPVNVDLALTTIEGRVITQKDNAATLNVAHIAPGIYLLRISDQEGNVLKVEKIIKH